MNEVSELIKSRENDLKNARRRIAAARKTEFTPIGKHSLDRAVREMHEALCNHCEAAFRGREGWDCIDISPCPDMLRLVGRLANFKEMGE